MGALMLLASYGLSVSLPVHLTVEWPMRGYAILSWPCLVLALNAGLGWSAMVAGLLLSVGLMLASLPLYQPVDAGVARRWLPRGFFLNAYVVHLLVLTVVSWFVH
ncbi:MULTISPECIES: hypothetical protein [Serratia]|uniref:hypothetical protein n=1 Tax=Serratia TaxID=613 RepID=UPI001F4C0AED|nr:hypothetical protein [Serratia proteamaculans]